MKGSGVRVPASALGRPMNAGLWRIWACPTAPPDPPSVSTSSLLALLDGCLLGYVALTAAGAPLELQPARLGGQPIDSWWSRDRRFARRRLERATLLPPSVTEQTTR